VREQPPQLATVTEAIYSAGFQLAGASMPLRSISSACSRAHFVLAATARRLASVLAKTRSARFSSRRPKDARRAQLLPSRRHHGPSR
jgi:hypothetical protein